MGLLSRERARRWRVLIPSLAALICCVLLTVGWDRARWRDRHIGYFPRPVGYSAIVARFGRPCNDDANAVWMTWREADTGDYQTFRFHRLLGGMGTEVVSDKGGASTRLDNDVKGHIIDNGKQEWVRHGIWGYNCRFIAGTTTWSLHAWGAAIDVSSAYEHVGHDHSHVNWHHAGTWQNHGWNWGKEFGDSMHFEAGEY